MLKFRGYKKKKIILKFRVGASAVPTKPSNREEPAGGRWANWDQVWDLEEEETNDDITVITSSLSRTTLEPSPSEYEDIADDMNAWFEANEFEANDAENLTAPPASLLPIDPNTFLS